MRLIRFIGKILTFSSLTLAVSNAVGADQGDIRPTFLLTSETAGTLGPRQMTLSAFDTFGRIGYGMSDNLELRLDANVITSSDTSKIAGMFSPGAKYRFMDNGQFALAAQVNLEWMSLATGNTTSPRFRVPLTLNLKSVLFTLVPTAYYSKVGNNYRLGGDAGVVVPLNPTVALIGEFKYWSQPNTTPNLGAGILTGLTAGLVLMPYPQVTIPIVLAFKDDSIVNSPVRFGLNHIFAHIGFQF